MKKVVIAGNTSDTAGGGIASNGDLIIGKKSLSGEDSDKEGSQMEDNQIEYSDNYGTGESILLDSPISTETTEVKAAEIKGTQAVDTPIPTEKSVVENLVATETTQVNTPASTEVPAVQAAASGNPDAGDTINLFAGVLLMVMSGIGLVAIANFGKKE
jgi:predicted outer membrane repeat protein